MSRIKHNELFQHVSGFLKTRGIELSAGAYAERIRAGCAILTDAVNMTQAAVEKAKTGVDARLDQVRQAIHEKTAPKPAAGKTKASRARTTRTAPPKARKKAPPARKAK